MSSILFTHSYFLRFDQKQWHIQEPYPPLMTITAAALMRDKGHHVNLFDSMFAEGPERLRPWLEAEKPKYLVIFDDGFNYLTKMCLTNMRHAAFEMAHIAQEYNVQVIVCSSDSTDHYEKYLQNKADFVIIGEGELTLLNLVDKLEAGDDDFEELQGLAFQRNGATIHTGRKEPLKELDMLPMAAWDLINIEDYRECWYSNHVKFALNMSTTRGCPFKCNWCAKPIYGNRYNSRSPEKVAEELEYLLTHFGPEYIWFTDDIFGLKPNWVQQFNEEVQKRNLSFKYTIQSRADLLLKGDTTEALAASGCEEIWIGAESGSQKILDAMEKGTKVEQIYEARKRVKENGMRMAFFLQFGYLGEEKADIDATIQMMLDLMPDDIGVSISYPLPGTKFYEIVKDDLQGQANWAESDELAMMFRNTYSPRYYKELHRYVHRLFRGKQSWDSTKTLIQTPFSKSGEALKQSFNSTLYLLAAGYHYWRLKAMD